MDVDLLRPGTVPISKDTVLWFEFLLDPNLLLNHLQKNVPDPSATELIIKFIASILDSVKNDVKPIKPEDQSSNNDSLMDIKPQNNLKNLALKILCLKILAYMKWNLNIIEVKIPVKFQIFLLQDLLYFTNDNNKIEIPNIPEYDLLSVSEQYLFALVLYHRWLLRMIIQRGLHMRIPKQNGDIIIGTIDDCFITTQELITTSINFLNAALTLDRTPKLLVFDTFAHLNEDTKDIQHKWDAAPEIPRYEYEGQIHYDLACFHFYREEYDLAKQHFLKCSDCFYNSDPTVVPFVYASVDPDHLHGFMFACGIPMDGHVPHLLKQLHDSIANKYTGILQILQEDNRAREIPLLHRIILELDIQGAVSSEKFTVAKDLLLQVQMLNVVRCVLDDETSYLSDYEYRLKNGGSKTIDMLFWAIKSLFESCYDEDRIIVKDYLLKLLMTEAVPELFDRLMAEDIFKNLFSSEDLLSMPLAQLKIDDVPIPDSLMNLDWTPIEFSARRNLNLETKLIEQSLITTDNIQTIRELLTKLAAASPTKLIWRLNSSWELAIPLQSVVMSMTRGFLQDFAYVLLAKSKELLGVNKFTKSIEMLTVLEAEITANSASIAQNIATKLSKLIQWEILLIQIMDLFTNWPADLTEIKEELVPKCKSCLAALEAGDSVIPRLEVTEQCALCLLNLNEWEYLCGLDKRWNYFEMSAAVAYACQDLIKYKANKKLSRDMWDLVLPIFGPSPPQTKRSASGNTTLVHRESPTINTKTNLTSFLACLRDDTTLSVVISMLARLYNILKDESSLELVVEYTALWPAVISNAISYNIQDVCEILLQLVQQALQYYPNMMSWHKLLADIYFSNGNYETAIKYYLNNLVIATEYFKNPPVKPLVDELIFRRMIKCCTQINCHTQAALLCQFLDDIDYNLAFKCLGDNKSTNSYDAIDSYYNCIWDTTILEYLVYLHSKRGEMNRKQKAIKAIGMFEINLNNNEEIQREAINIRKTRFLRSLAKQYLLQT